MIRGVDVSENQDESLPWAVWLAQSGIRFAFIRGSIGYRQDAMFVTHRRDARADGVLTGTYHAILHHDPEIPFFDPARQARVFAGRLEHAQDDELPAVVDVEAAGVNDSLLAAFIGELRFLSPRRLMIYTSQSKWHVLIGRGKVQYAKFPLWVADYSGPVDLPDIWTRATIHQTSGTGRLAPYAGPIDLDEFDGTETELRRLALPGAAEDFMPSIDEALRARIVAEATKAKAAGIAAQAGAQAILDLLPAPDPSKHTLGNLTNQQVINLFNAATGGLGVLQRIGLLASLAGNRNALYTGPAVEDLTLTDAEKSAVILAL